MGGEYEEEPLCHNTANPLAPWSAYRAPRVNVCSGQLAGHFRVLFLRTAKTCLGRMLRQISGGNCGETIGATCCFNGRYICGGLWQQQFKFDKRKRELERQSGECFGWVDGLHFHNVPEPKRRRRGQRNEF